MTDDPPLDQAATTTNALLLPDAVLYAFDILPDGRAEALETAELSTDCQAGAAYRWIHLDMTADGLLEWLSDNTDDIIACSLTEEDTSQDARRMNKGFFSSCAASTSIPVPTRKTWYPSASGRQKN